MFRFLLLDHDPRDGTVEFEVLDESGAIVMHAMATMIEQPGDMLVLADFMVYGAGPQSIGPILRRAARDFLRETGYAERLVVGTRRTSGAGPGRYPAPLRFR